jgi:hypothetical protein
LQLSRVREAQQIGCLWWLGMTVLGLVVGAAAGWCLGQLGARLFNNPFMVWTFPILGGIDGIASAILLLGCTSEGEEAARQRLHPALIGLTFMVLGLKVGVGGNWPMALVGSALNGMIGFLVAWICMLRIRAAELNDELDRARNLVR